MRCNRCGIDLAETQKFCHECGKKMLVEHYPPKKAAKAPRGAGSIRTLRSGKFQVRVMENGVSRSLGVFDTKKQAERALADYHRAKETKCDIYDFTLKQMYEKYQKSVRYQQLSPKGKEGVHTAWKHLQKLYDTPIRELKTSDYEILIQNEKKFPRYKIRTKEEIAKMKPSEKAKYQALIKQEPEPISRETKKKIKDLVKMLCDIAIGENVITQNYGLLVVIESEASGSYGVYSKEMRDALFANDEYEEVKLMLIYIYMGFRADELLSIDKKDVHLEAEVTARGNYAHGYIVAGNKTEAGRRREVPIHEKILPYIHYFLAKRGKYFITRKGSRVNTDYYRRTMFKKAMEIANLPPCDEYGDVFKPHSTRNTFALMLYEAGVSNEVIAKLIGHKDFTTTNKKYIRNRQSRKFVENEFSKLSASLY